MIRTEERDDDGRGTADVYSAEPCTIYAATFPPPSDPHGPVGIREIRPGGWIGRRSAVVNVSLFRTFEEARLAAVESEAR